MNRRIKKLLSYYKPYLSLLITDLLCAFVVAAIALILPLCMRYITKEILTSGAADTLNQIYTMGLLMLALILIQTLCNAYVDYQGHMMGAQMERDIRHELFTHYQTLSFSFYDNQQTGQLMNRITNDSFAIGELCHHAPEDIVLTTIKFMGTFIILLTINVSLTLIIFAFLPVMTVYAFYFNAQMNRALRTSKDRVGDINAQVEDSLAGIRVVQAFTNSSVEIEKFAVANNHFLDSRRADHKSEAYFYNGITAFTHLFTVAVIIFGSVTIVNGTLDLADLVTYLLYIALLIEPVKTALNFARLYNEGITGLDRIMEMLEQQPLIQDKANAISLTNIAGEIAFHDVTFKYKEGQTNVLQQLSLHITAGEFVALVGTSGVGKTTLCALIPRFYDVQHGTITLDGHDLKNIRLDSLRSHIGIVQQDVYLFAGTVADNIAYGKVGASQAQIVAAAKKANAHNFITTLPNGYDTDIGQRGVKLSGGQKQRLSIARVFLKNPPIIIFDEATSALDNESERAVQAAIEQLTNNRTVIVIAHRLSTIRNAQRILVLNEDGVAEEGTHHTLIRHNGTYAQLYHASQQEHDAHPTDP